jgi:hypothetical protein
MAKTSKTTNKKTNQTVDYEPIKVGLAVATVAAVSLVLVALIVVS